MNIDGTGQVASLFGELGGRHDHLEMRSDSEVVPHPAMLHRVQEADETVEVAVSEDDLTEVLGPLLENAVRFARRFTDDVEFSPEDAGRSEVDFLCRVLEAVIKEGARTVNIPDTVGFAIPEEFGRLISSPRLPSGLQGG